MNVSPFPLRVEIELSSVCNLRCVYCPRRYVPDLDRFQDTALFKRLIDEITQRGTRAIVLHRRGESLMHPDFAQLLEYCRGKFDEVQMATNATLMTREKIEAMVNTLTFVSFSIDLPERLHRTRGADYSLVERNIDGFLEFNRNTRTQVSMVRTPDVTDEDVARFTDIWKDKVDRVRAYEEHSRDGAFGSLGRRRPDRKPCVKPFTETVVLSTGHVVRCNHDWNGPSLGDVNAASLAEVWEGEIYANLRRQHEALEFTDETCAACDSWYPELGVQGTGDVWERKNGEKP